MLDTSNVGETTQNSEKFLTSTNSGLPPLLFFHELLFNKFDSTDCQVSKVQKKRRQRGKQNQKKKKDAVSPDAVKNYN